MAEAEVVVGGGDSGPISPFLSLSDDLHGPPFQQSSASAIEKRFVICHHSEFIY
jgi:hypothetical protein